MISSQRGLTAYTRTRSCALSAAARNRPPYCMRGVAPTIAMERGLSILWIDAICGSVQNSMTPPEKNLVRRDGKPTLRTTTLNGSPECETAQWTRAQNDGVGRFLFRNGSRYSYLAATRIASLHLETGATVRWRAAYSPEVIRRAGSDPFAKD